MKRISDDVSLWKISPGNGIPIWRQILARLIIFFALVLSAIIWILPILLILTGIISILYFVSF